MQPCDIRPGNLIDYRGHDSNVEYAKQHLNDDKEVFWLLSYALDEVLKEQHCGCSAGWFRDKNPYFLIQLLLDAGIIDKEESNVMKSNCDRWFIYWVTR